MQKASDPWPNRSKSRPLTLRESAPAMAAPFRLHESRVSSRVRSSCHAGTVLLKCRFGDQSFLAWIQTRTSDACASITWRVTFAIFSKQNSRLVTGPYHPASGVKYPTIAWAMWLWADRREPLAIRQRPLIPNCPVEWKGLCTAVQPERPKSEIYRTFSLLLCRCRANASGGWANVGPASTLSKAALSVHQQCRRGNMRRTEWSLIVEDAEAGADCVCGIAPNFGGDSGAFRTTFFDGKGGLCLNLAL